MSIVYVVQVFAVQDGGVATSVAVNVGVRFGRYVLVGRALVVVVVVSPVHVLVMEVVDVVVMAYRDVAAVLPVFVVVGFGPGVVCDAALVVVPVVGVVEVSAVEVVDVAFMLHRVVAAVRPVDVGVLPVDRVSGFGGHRVYPSSRGATRPSRAGYWIPGVRESGQRNRISARRSWCQSEHSTQVGFIRGRGQKPEMPIASVARLNPVGSD